MEESLKQEREPFGAEAVAVADDAAVAVAPRRAFLASVRGVALERGAELLCALLLALMSLNLLTVVARKSITVDEIVMIPSAYYHLVAGNYQLVNEHPPLSKFLAALPLLFIQPREMRPAETNVPPNTPGEEWVYQERFWEDNREDFRTISFWSRVPMVALAVGLGVLV
ncbi:MAG TPA: hypothetical protein VFS10_08135, partial [Pyrinomonadaceae bacterium]|nr:hypothetical protein [Pyrinomonadaceae bacterium]